MQTQGISQHIFAKVEEEPYQAERARRWEDEVPERTPRIFLSRPGAREKDTRRSLWHFVLPAASTLGLVGLLLYFSEYVLADSLGLLRSRSAVAAVKMALDA